MPRHKANERAREALGLHKRIRVARIRAGISTEQMAIWLGVHQSNYTRIETGKVAVSAERVLEVSRLLNVSVAELYGELPPVEERDTDVEPADAPHDSSAAPPPVTKTVAA